MECEEHEPLTGMRKFLYPVGQWFADFFFLSMTKIIHHIGLVTQFSISTCSTPQQTDVYS